MADFDWNWPTKIERDVIERALTLDFPGRDRAALSAGGTQRSPARPRGCSEHLSHAAVLAAGSSVLFPVRTAAPLKKLHRQTPEGRRRQAAQLCQRGACCALTKSGTCPSTARLRTYSTM